MRVVLGFLGLASILALGSCKQRCDDNLDCDDGSFCSRLLHHCEIECFDDNDCRLPVECRANPANCAPKGLYCSHRGQCVGQVDTRPMPEEYVPGLEKPTDGWSDRVGTGLTFVFDTFAIGGDGVGFNLNAEDGIDNVLGGGAHGSVLRSEVNGLIAQGLSGGSVLLLIEIAGLDLPYDGNDDSVTIKIYGAIDADFPIDPLNNFRDIPNRSTPCCEFRINEHWLTNEPGPTPEETVRQAAIRAPARIENFRLYAPVNYPHYSFNLEFLLTLGATNSWVTVAKSKLELDLDSDLEHLRSGVIGGGLTASSLARIVNPLCRGGSGLCPSNATVTAQSTLLDLAASFAGPSPDVDVDGDGRECFLAVGGADGLIDVCCDGDGSRRCLPGETTCAEGKQIEGDPAERASCALKKQVADGYSVGLTFSGRKATIVGTGTE